MAVPAFEEFEAGRRPRKQAPDQSSPSSPLLQTQFLKEDVGARFVRGLLYAAPVSVILWVLIALCVWLILSD